MGASVSTSQPLWETETVVGTTLVIFSSGSPCAANMSPSELLLAEAGLRLDAETYFLRHQPTPLLWKFFFVSSMDKEPKWQFTRLRIEGFLSDETVNSLCQHFKQGTRSTLQYIDLQLCTFASELETKILESVLERALQDLLIYVALKVPAKLTKFSAFVDEVSDCLYNIKVTKDKHVHESDLISSLSLKHCVVELELELALLLLKSPYTEHQRNLSKAVEVLKEARLLFTARWPERSVEHYDHNMSVLVDVMKGSIREDFRVFPPMLPPIRVLAMDGGGTRSVVITAALEALIKKLQVEEEEFFQSFDLLCGTSTGGVVAMGLVDRLTLSQLSEIFLDFEDSVFSFSFSDIFGRLHRRLWRGGWYRSQPLSDLYLKWFGSAWMCKTEPNTSQRCFVTTTCSQAAGRSILLRNYMVTDDEYSTRVRRWQAARATTAAPLYFDPLKVDQWVFLDGGIVSNNPAFLAYTEVRRLHPGREILLISCGTGAPPDSFEEKWWQRPGLRAGLMTASNSEATHRDLELLAEVTRDLYYVRLNPSLESELFTLDTCGKTLHTIMNQSRTYVEEEILDLDFLKQALFGTQGAWSKLDLRPHAKVTEEKLRWNTHFASNLILNVTMLCAAFCAPNFLQRLYPSPTSPLPLQSRHLYDVFLSHAWDSDREGRNTHERVGLVNAQLKDAGICTWFDQDRMEGNIVDQMTNGIENSALVIVFVTQAYMEKVMSNSDGNCKLEFNHSVRVKTTKRIISVVFEPCMKDTRDWMGALGGRMGDHLYIDMSKDEDATELISKIKTELR
eukprot:Lithocolla_globosa_v1_NODE_1492_length_2536_cov_46.306608.p1 type:complete len:791 gc:universal NODE_1492_length_2536_cov_46.306608:57-2429(+)